MKIKVMDIILCLLALLFIYAALTKLLEYDLFKAQIGKSPFITAYSEVIAWSLPAIEIILGIALFTKRFQLIALYASFSLMLIFTAYIAFMLAFTPQLPCSCGGILNNLGWKEHLVFNIAFTVLAIVGVVRYDGERNFAPDDSPPTSRKSKKNASARKIITLAGCALLCLALLSALYLRSPLHSTIYRGKFSRNIREKVLEKTGTLSLGYDSYYISGLDDKRIYLSNYMSPLHLVSLNHALTDSTHIQLTIANLDSLVRPQQLRTLVEPPYFFIVHGINPYIFRGKTDTWQASQFMPDSAFFAEIIPISSSSFVLRSYSNKTQAYELAKEFPTAPYFQFNYDALEKQEEGIFSTEGKLHYNPETHEIIHLYTYKNEYAIFDTTLTIKRTHHTIDDIQHANLKVAHIKSDNSSMLSAPPAVVNGPSSIANGKMYILSNILDQKSDEQKFNQNSMIDVYDLAAGAYLYSFYLENYANNKMTYFKVHGKKLVALFGDHVISYTINSQEEIQQQNLTIQVIFPR